MTKGRGTTGGTRSTPKNHLQPFPRDGELSYEGIEAEVIQGEAHLFISELGTEGQHVMIDRREAAALRDWLAQILK